MSNDDLQYGFQQGCSTLQCTWAVQETVSHYMQNGSNVFCCLLDFSKAFDLVNFKELFKKLINKKVPFILLRLLVYIYKNQQCYVKWNSKKSDSFSIGNGMRQGAILSPCLFCIYLDTLLKDLRKSGLGCHIGDFYFGALGYADDVILMSPSRTSLQLMLNICQKFAEKHSMVFSTDPHPSKSKTKCMLFSKDKNLTVPKMTLNGEKLPWVPKAKHLGNNLTVEVSKNKLGIDTSADLLQKRAIFFHKVHELKQAYGGYSPKLVCEIIKIFGTSFYGSPLWSLKSDEHLKLNRAWNTVVKIVFDLPFQTHTRFIESLIEFPHLQSMLHGRYIGFTENLKNSKKSEIKVLFNYCMKNKQSNTGQNISYLMNAYKISELDDLFSEKFSIKNARVYPLDESESWKPKLIEELSLVKMGLLDNGFEDELVDDILTDICIN